MTTNQQSQFTKKSIPGDELSLLSNSELHQKFTELGRERHRLTYELLYLLPKISHRQIYREKGFLTIYEYAAKTAGLGHSAVEKALRLGRVLEDKPALMETVKTEGVHKVALVATIATRENERQLAEKVVGMSKSALADFAKEVRTAMEVNRLGERGNNGGRNTWLAGECEGEGPVMEKGFEETSWLDGEFEGSKTAGDKEVLRKCQAAEQKITITLEGNLLFEFLKMKQMMEKKEKVGLSNVQVVKRLLDCKEEKLRTNNNSRKQKKSGTGDTRCVYLGPNACGGPNEHTSCQDPNREDCSKQHAESITSKHDPSPGTKPVTRYIHAAQKRTIIAQTAGKCAYPGCQRPYDQIHHRERFSNQPSHSKSHKSAIPLCTNHHKFAHNQLISNESGSRDEWMLSLNNRLGTSDAKVIKFW